MSRKRRRLSDRRQPVLSGRKLLFDFLEPRDMPAGGLSAQIIGGTTVRLFSDSKVVDLTGTTTGDNQNLQAFFNSANGQAGTRSFAGTMTVGNKVIGGTFALSEFGATGGVQVIVAGASMQMGTGQGVGLANADGAFALLPTGAAGVVKTGGTAGSNSVVGIKGLSLTASAGLSFEVNQTGQSVSKTVTTPTGAVVISYATGANVLDVAGAADFKVAGPSGTAVRVGGSFVMTDPTSGTGLAIAGKNVAVDLYAGATRAVSLGSATASFTLGAAGFALGTGTFTAGRFQLLPTNQPDAAGVVSYPAAATSFTANLGPINLQQVSPVLSGLSFGPSGLSTSVGISANTASVTFSKTGAAMGAGDAPMNVAATGLVGTFGIAGAVSPTTGAVTSFSAPGTFSFAAALFDLNVPKVLDATASGLQIGYDPTITGGQQIFAANSVSVSVPKLNLQGSFTSKGTNPALVVRTDGFAFDEVVVQNTNEDGIKIGQVKAVKPYVKLDDFSFSSTAGSSLGSFAVGAERLEVGSDTTKAQAYSTDIEATLSFGPAGGVKSFTLMASSFGVRVGSFVTFAGSDVVVDPKAVGADPVFSASTVSATATIAAVGLTLAGSASNLQIGSGGDVLGPDKLTVSAAFDDSTASRLKLPSYLPFRLNSLKLDWDDFRNTPSHFTIDVSASIKGKFGPVNVEGGVESLKLDPIQLQNGQNPIIDVGGFFVSAKGNLFGGTIDGTLIAGVIKVDALNNVLPSDAKDYTSTIFYGGIKAAFDFKKVSASILVGFSEKGLLSAYLGADVPVILDPTTGLALGNFHGGVTFNATPFPVIADPSDLTAPIFQPTLKLDTDQWESQLRQQVVNQVSGGSRIFNVESGNEVIAELTTGQIAVGGATDKLFTENEQVVTTADDPAHVTTILAGSLWEIDYKDSVFYVRKGEGTHLDVSQVRFNLKTVTADALTASRTLHAVPAALVADFRASGVTLSGTAQVMQVQGGDVPAAWKVVDGDVTYFISTWGSGANVKLGVTGGDASFGQMNSVIRIEAGATLYSTYATKNAFTADVDIIITSDGKFLIAGALTLANSVTADIKLFGDLSSIGSAHPNVPLSLVSFVQMPAPTDNTPALVTLKGTMTFAFRDAAGNLVNPLFTPAAQLNTFEFTMLGQAIVGVPDTAALVFGGSAGAAGGYAQLKLTVKNSTAATEVRLDASGSVSIQGVIEAGDLVSAAGTLVIKKAANQPVEAYGAVDLNLDTSSPGLSFLRNAGLSAAQADLLLALNTSTQSRDLTLTLPGRNPENFKLAAATLELQGSGTLKFANGTLGIGADVSFAGAFAARISVDVPGSTSTSDTTVQGDNGVDLDLFVAGKLDVGLTVGNNHFNLLDLDGQGLVAVRDIGAKKTDGTLKTPKFAARVDLAIAQGVPGVFEAQGSVQLLLNTFGRDFTYVIPARLLDTIDTLNQLRNKPGASVTSLPALTGYSITVPGAPPQVLAGGTPQPAGPYFALQFGNPNEVTGMTDVSLKLLNTFQLVGNFQVVASTGSFQMTADATASITLPGAGSILNAEASGVLSIDSNGFFGGLGIQSSLSLPGIGFSGDTKTYLGINTTAQSHVIPFSVGKFVSPTIAARSGAIYVGGSIQFGALKVDGSFQLMAGAQAINLDVDGKISFAGIPALSVTGSAAIYYGMASNQNGLVLHAGLTLGDGGTIGVPGVFEIGGSLQLNVDTRPASYLVQVQVNNASVKVLNAITFAGSANIIFAKDVSTQQPYFSVSANLSANFLNVMTVSAYGMFDSRGYIDLHLSGHLALGTDDFGISADASFFITKTATIPLDFGGSLSGQVRAFGITLAGASIAIDYDGYGPGEGQTGRIDGHATVTVFDIDKHVDFTLGYLVLDASAAPNLASIDGSGIVTLNVGALKSHRAYANSQENEAYTIESIGRGTHRGELIQVQAFGVSQTFDDVIAVNGNFGSGRDQLLIRPSFGTFAPSTAMGVNISGSGQDQFINESARAVRFDAGASTSDAVLQSSGAGSTLIGGSGNDALFAAGAGNTLTGNGGDDTIRWAIGSGASIVNGGAGNDTLLVSGTDATDGFTLDGGAAGLTIAAAGGTLTATGIENLKVYGRGGADTATVYAAGLAAAGLAAIDLDLSRFQGTSTTNSNVETLIDDGAADSVVIVGTLAVDTFATSKANGDVATTWSATGQGSLTINTRQSGVTDTVTINAGDGNDTFSVTGQVAGLIENGQGGDDTFNQSVGAATIDGGSGANTANFEVQAADYQNVTLTAAQVYAAQTTAASSASLLTALTNLAAVNIKTDATAGRVTIQGTKAGTTTGVTLAAGSFLDVKATAGPLSVTLNGTASALLETTGGAATMTGTGGAGGTLTVGVGLLTQLGAVTATNVDNVVFDDSQDGTGRTATLSPAGLSLSGRTSGVLAMAGARAVTFAGGLGNDTINVAAGSPSFTVNGGAGTDALAVTLTGAPTGIGKVAVGTGVESASFTNTNTAAAAWILTGQTLASGGVTLLDASLVANTLAVTLGNGAGTTVQVGSVTRPTTLTTGTGGTTVTVGGGLVGFDSIAQPLTLTTSAGSNLNSLVLDDTSVQLDKTRTIGGGVAAGTTQAGTISYAAGKFGSLQYKVGVGQNTVNLAGGQLATTTITGNTSSIKRTQVNATGDVGNLNFAGGGGADVLQITPGGGINSVTYAGGASPSGTQDALSVNNPAATTATDGLSGTTGAATAALRLGNLTINLNQQVDVEAVTVNLGASNDTFIIDVPTTYALPNFTLNGGAGDDTVTVKTVNGASGAYVINGGDGLDTISVRVTTPPTVANLFGAINPQVENLVVDGAANPTAIAWAVNGSTINAGAYSVINSAGASQVTIAGGTSNNDTLTVSGGDGRPVNATVNGSLVSLTQGSVVLSQSQSPTLPTPYSGTVTGLTGANQVATTPDGNLVFASGTDSTVAVFRKGANGLLVFLRGMTLPSGTPTALAMTPDGKMLLIGDNRGDLYTYSIDSTSGTVSSPPSSYSTVADAIGQLVVSPDGQKILQVGTTAANGFVNSITYVRNATSNSITGVGSYPAVVPTTAGRLSFSSDSTQLYIPNKGGSVAVYSFSSQGALASVNSVANNAAGLVLKASTQTQISLDGTLLLTYSSGDTSVNYYSISTDNDPLKMKFLGSIAGVGGVGSSDVLQNANVFKFDDADQALFVLTDTGRTLKSYSYNSSTETFALLSSVPVPGGRGYSLDVGLATNTTYGYSYAAISSTSFGAIKAELDIFFVYSPGSSRTPGTITTGFTAAKNYPYSGPVGVLNPASTTGLPTFIAAYNDGGYGGYGIYDAAGNTLSELVTRSSGANNYSDQVLDLAVYKNPKVDGNSTTGLSSYWLGLERASDLSHTFLTVNQLTVDSSGKYSTKVTYRYTLNDIGLSNANRIRISNDGSRVYILGLTGGAVAAVPCVMLYQYGLQLDFFHATTGAYSNIAASDVAVANSKVYAVNSNTPGLFVLTPGVYGLTGAFADATKAPILNGFNAYDLTGASAVASSADNSLLYVVTTTGNLITLNVNSSTQSTKALGSINYYAYGFTSTASNRGTDILRYGANGDELAISGAGTLYFFTTSSGVPQTSVVSTIGARSHSLPMEGAADLAFSSSALYVVSAASTANSLIAFPFDGNQVYATGQKFVQGQSYSVSVSGLADVAVTPNNLFAYGISPADNTVAVLDKSTNVWKPFVSDYNIWDMSGVSLVAAALSGSTSLGYAISPKMGTLSIFSGASLFGQVTRTEFLGAKAMAVSADGSSLYVSTATSIYRFALTYSTMTFSINPVASGSIANIDLLRLGGTAGHLYASNSTDGLLWTLDPISTAARAQVTGLTGVTGLAVVGTDIYASSSSALGTLYHLTDATYLQRAGDSYSNGQNFVQGLDGASDAVASSDGRYVFVASKTDGTVAVFGRNGTTGALTFVQLLRDGRGANGITQPTALAISGTTLTVASAAGPNGTAGGLSFLNISAAVIPAPAQFLTSFSKMKSLAVNGGSSADTIRVVQAPGTIPLTINGNGGGDLVSIADLGLKGSNVTTTVNFGGGTNELVVNQTYLRSDAGNLVATGGSGSDTFNIQALARGSQVTIGARDTAAVVDVIRIAGAGLADVTSVTVNGRTATTVGGQVTGPVLFYNGAGASVSAGATTSGTISLDGQGSVTFNNLNYNTTNPQQVFVSTPPKPSFTITPASGSTPSEGVGVTLTASDAAGLAGVTYAWDLDGDGQFTDATGSTVVLSWGQLVALGISTRGSYPIAVRATTAQNSQQFAGQSYQASADAGKTLTIADTLPTVTATGGSVVLGQPFTLAMSASDPGLDRVTQWQISWGDGTAATTLGSGDSPSSHNFTNSVSHTYARPGSFTVTVTASEGAISGSTSTTVTAQPGATTLGLDAASYSINAGTGLAASVVTAAPANSYAWQIKQGSTVVRTLAPISASLSVTWADLGLTTAGSYTLAVTGSYGGGVTATTSAPLTVVAVAPTATLAVSAGSVPQGSVGGAIGLTISNIVDPAPGASPRYTVDYDFDNDGTVDLAGAGLTVGIPASFLATPGPRVAAATLRSASGLSARLTVAYSVSPVAPTLTLSSPSAILEGGTASVTPTLTGPGVTVSSWRFDYGDGQVDVVADPRLSFPQAHKYLNNKADGTPYTITVTATTNSGDVTQATTVAVADVKPVVTLRPLNPAVTEGVANSMQLNVAVTDPGSDVVAGYTVSWGDGTVETFSGDNRTPTHTYATTAYPAASFPVTVTALTDNDGTYANSAGSLANTLNIAVANVAPTIVPSLTQVPAVGSQGTALSFGVVATSVAAGIKPLSFTWTVTDPVGATTTLPATNSAPYLVDASFLVKVQYAAGSSNTFTPIIPGNYTVRVVVADGRGGSNAYSWSVAVADVAPTITGFAVPTAGIAGQPIGLVGAATDIGGTLDPLTYTWTMTEQATGTVQTLIGASTQFTPRGGRYVVQLAVGDSFGQTTTQSAPIDVINPGPAIAAGAFIVPATGLEGGSATFGVLATDPSGNDGLTYTWKVVDPAGNLTTLAGPTVGYSYTTPGSYAVSVTISNPTGQSIAASATVAVANVAPTIIAATVPTTGMEGVAIPFAVSASDPGGAKDPLSYAWTITGVGDTTVLTGPAPQFVPADNGTYAVSLVVTDSYGGTATRDLGTITVADIAPSLGAIAVPTTAIAEGQSATFSVAPAADVAADQDTIRYDWIVTGPGGVVRSFADQGRTLAFGFTDNGTYVVAVTATDKDGLASAASTVTVAVANLAPAITANSIPTGGYVGFVLPLSAAATDVPADLGKLTYTWTITTPTGSSFTLAGPAPAFTPTAAGTYAVSLTVADTDGGTQVVTGTIAVKASPITLASLVLPTDSVEASSVALSASATDDLGGAFTYTWTVTGPDGKPVAVAGSGASVSFLPPDNGEYQVSVVARTANGSASQAGSVAVSNLPPTIERVTMPTTAAIGVASVLSASATDPAGAADPLTYTWTITTPTGAPFATLTGTQVAFTPTQSGIYGVSLTVDDGDGGRSTITRLVAVLNSPPVASAGGPYAVLEGGIVQLDALTGSSDNDQSAATLTYAWDFTGDGRFADAAGSKPIFSAANLDGPTSVTVRVRVTDDQGAVAYASGTILVANVAPTITGLTPSAAAIGEGGSVSLMGTIADPGLADSHVVTVDWGDGSAATVVNLAAGVTNFTTPGHAYLDNPAGGSATIRVTVADKDGSVSPASTRAVAIANVAPTATIAGPAAGTFGPALAFTLAATDPSPADTAAGFKLVVDWGDGTNDTFTGATSKLAAHSFLAAGNFTIKLSATDKDGGVSLVATRTVAIAQAIPTFTLAAPASTFDGTPYHSATGQVVGLGGQSLGAAALTYYLGSDSTLGSPLAAAPTNAGSYLVVASYTGGGNYAAARSAPVAFAVAQRATTIAVTVATTPAIANQATTLTATVATGLTGLFVPAGEAVQFRNNGVNIGAPVSLNADGTATLSITLTAGTRSITAAYTGDPNFLASTSSAASLVIYGPGAYAVGSTLLLVGASTSDYAQISPAGSKADGTTGLAIGATLNNTWISKTFAQAFTAISIVGDNGNDNFQLADNLTQALTVTEGNGNNYIKAARGNDSFTFGAGSNQVFGGTGTKSVVARDSAGTASYYSFGDGDHTFSLGHGNDQVVVGDGNNVIRMGNGADQVITGNGNNTIRLGDGNSYVRTGNGADTISLGDGNANVQVGDGAKSISLGNGFNYVRGGNGPVILAAGDGNNTVQLGNGANTVTLGDGNNDLSAGNGDNTITVGDGNNNIRLGDGDNVVVEGNGTDYVRAGNGANLVVGGKGQHTIQLGNGNNILIDGSATLTTPGDSFRQILTDWKTSSSTSVNTRIKVTTNKSYPNALLAGSGRNWFFYNYIKDTTTKKASDRLN